MDIRHETSNLVERIKDFYYTHEYMIKSALIGTGVGIATGTVYYLGYKSGMKSASLIITAGIINKKPELLAEVVDCVNSLNE